MDYLVCRLTGLERPQMTQQLADSWGYFDRQGPGWDPVITDALPSGLLPHIVEAGSWAGKVVDGAFPLVPELKVGTPVLAALGDFQAHFYAAEKTQHAAIMNMGTSAQLSFEMPEGFEPPLIFENPPKPVQYFPYLGKRYVAVAASLNGGNTLDAFLQAFKSWLEYLAPGLELPDDDALWERMETALVQWEDERSPFTLPTVTPTLFGERHNPTATAAVTGLSDPNIGHLPGLLGSLVVGLVSNLFSMITPELLRQSGVKEIVLTGLATKPWFAPAVRRFLGKHNAAFVVSQAAKKLDSAYGAALIAGQYLPFAP